MRAAFPVPDGGSRGSARCPAQEGWSLAVPHCSSTARPGMHPRERSLPRQSQMAMEHPTAPSPQRWACRSPAGL
eukprot:scaffold66683_cov76-Phaeocystis_antarctica.AAC.1